MKSLNSQSFLIIGPSAARRQETKNLLAKVKINLGKISPDIFVISPLKQKVTIEQIRGLKSHIFQKPVSLPYKTIIIEEAEMLTTEAQNALLKILEEPPASALIILEAKDKTQILPTILSRVVTIAAEEKRETETKSILLGSKDTLRLLEEIANIENPSDWLDDQMLALYNLLTTGAKLYHTGGDIRSHIAESANSPSRLSSEVRRGRTKEGHSGLSRIRVAQIENAIRQCAQAKQMIDANVNPHFVLANLILNIPQTR